MASAQRSTWTLTLHLCNLQSHFFIRTKKINFFSFCLKEIMKLVKSTRTEIGRGLTGRQPTRKPVQAKHTVSGEERTLQALQTDTLAGKLIKHRSDNEQKR